jgi:hypothetical protein
MPIQHAVAEQYMPARGSAFLRLLVATVLTGFVALVSALAWLLVQAQYINDYCTTRAPQPITSPPEALGGRPAYMDDPITVACEYDGSPIVYVTEPGPLLGALLITAIVIAVAFGAYHWARTSEGDRADDGRSRHQVATVLGNSDVAQSLSPTTTRAGITPQP